MKLYLAWLAILLSFVSCSQPHDSVEPEILGRQEGNVREFIYSLDGLTVKEKLIYSEDSVVFMERTDLDGNLLDEHRTIIVRAELTEIESGDPFRANVFSYGPKPCSDFMYFVSEAIPIDVETEGKQLIRRHTIEGDTAYFDLGIHNPGEYYFVGVFVLPCDTPTYPRQYNFRGEFTVIE